MELNNWEKEFKKQLDSREIKPSENAWARLDAMLPTTEKPKAKFRWMYIAASFVGFLLIGTLYFNQKRNAIVTEKNEVVVQNAIETKKNKKSSDILNTNTNNIENKVVADVSKKSKNPELRKETIIVKDSSSQNQAVVLINNQSKVNDVIANSSENKYNQSATKNKYISAEKLLAEVSDAKFEAKSTDETIEKTRKAISVNANDLLLNAETELNQSFRETALDRFNKKINTVKTVLVNRDYEE